MILLVDDQRNPVPLGHIDIIARTYAAGVFILSTGYITELYLDFDLGCEKTGLDILKNCFYPPPVITLVTQNPVGLKQMDGFLSDAGYKRRYNNGLVYEKIA